jgi:hypothetical protein
MFLAPRRCAGGIDLIEKLPERGLFRIRVLGIMPSAP